ncbi:MAG: PQQ-dependent sugar dehydrogenase [Proteobacteria bacterium]|nr:PQQ-dependent sugar dehydrogenase [Burkholderiales bacterium]
MSKRLSRIAAGAVFSALAFGAFSLPAPIAFAQQADQPPSAAEAERRRGMGGYFPERMKNPNLTGVPPKLTITPLEDIPLNKIQLPPGFKAEVYAHGIPGARMMARAPNGTLFVGTRTIGRVYAVYEKDGKRVSKIVAEKLNQPNGVLVQNGALYIAAINRVFRYDNIEANLENIPTPVDMTEAFKLPPDVHHNWKFLSFGPDKKIYFQVGAPCNQCEINPGVHGQIRRYNLDGTGMEIVARGVRNSVGFDFHPKTGELWFTDNGRDWAGEDGFDDELNRVPADRIGGHFGFPYCHANGQPDPDIKVPNPCANVILPVAVLGAHTAALGMRFYTGKMFPPEYQGAILLARHGSWNRTERNGYDILRVNATADGKDAKITPFMTGFMDKSNNSFWGRPTDVMMLPDGSLLVSDEQTGSIFRVTYGK